MKKLVLCASVFFLFCPVMNSDSSADSPQRIEPKKITIRQRLYRELGKTHLRGRIVRIKVKRANKQQKIYLTWHPYKEADIAKDTYVIVKSIADIIPDFHSISLKAIEPKSLRWTKRVFWRNVITRRELDFIKEKQNISSDKPRPLFD